MPEPLVVILLVVDALDALSVPYFIGGSVASAMYGLRRTTLDADIVADLRLAHAAPFAEALEGAFYVDAEMIRDAITHRASFNLLHLETMFKVDIFLPKDRPFDRIQFERRQERIIDQETHRSVVLASPEDTILAKLAWHRLGGETSARQWEDVLGVLRVQGERLDGAYMQHWAAELSISDVLARAIDEAEATNR
jgi:hypothetical protein